MRRKLLASLFGTLFFIVGQAQVVTVYQEDFDPPSGPDSVSTYNTNALLTSVWNDTTNLSVSAPRSYHSRVVPFDSVIFETNTFSTLNNVFVRLKFNQICKIHFGQRAYIQVSNNNGTTWQNVTSAMYQGPSPQFTSTGYFNELSYPNASASPYWYGPTLSAASIVAPTNSWWSEETFDVSSILGGVNGYTTCKVRFILVHQINTPINLSGWYVDNLLVEAAPCELEPPTFTYNVPPIRKPVGARYIASQEVKLKARDNTGVDSVKLFYRLNGGLWMDTNMTALTAGSCPDSSIYTFTWMNINLFDTIDWYVNIYDCACPNITRDPIISALPNYYTFWRDIAPPAICGPTYPNSYPKVVSTFPYFENFESSFWIAGTGTGASGTSHRGTFPTDNPPLGENWTVSPNSISTGFAWSIRSGGTATSQTGPSGNNTVGGSKYLYTEASQGNGSASAPVFTQLITPCIDLGVVNCAALEFYYHMYGANIDRIRIDVDTGTATSKYVNGIASIVGQQNNSETSPYKKAFISLEQFSGRIIRIRFTARKNTNISQDKNDIAIDDIRVFEPTPVDIEMVNYDAPLNGYCSYSNAEIVKGKFQSLGCQTLTSIPIACKIEHTSPAPASIVTTSFIRDTLNGSYPLGKDSLFSFAPTANLSAFGTYKLWIYSEVPNDTVNANDTVGPYTIEHRQPVTSFPHILDFDGAATIPGNGTPGNAGTTGTVDWERIPDPVNGGFAFHVMEGKTPTAATGPRNDYSGNGNYIYTEGNYGAAPVSALFVSKCLDLNGMTNPVIDFMYHMYGADISAIAVQIVPANSNAWINIPGASIPYTTPPQSASIDPWKYFKADLTTWAGQVVKLRFIAQKTGLGSAADIALDNIRVYNKIATDVGIIHIGAPAQRVDTAAPVLPQFTIRNFGTTSASNIPITYTITPNCGPNAGVPVTYTTTYTGTIPVGQDYVYTVPASAMPIYPVGTFTICAHTTKAGDTHSFNNEYCKESNGWPIIYIQNGFSENFDACNTGVAAGFWTNGDYRTFDVGTNTFSSSPNSYSTYEFQYNSYANTNEYLFAPRFIGFDTIVGAQLWFNQKFQFGGGDVGLIELLVGSTWQPLGFQDPDDAIGINWYNTANIAAINNGSGFTGNSSAWPNNTAGWITSMWPLNVYNFSSAPLIMRWRQVSSGGGTVGWAVDNVEIRIPPQNSASPYEIDTEEYLVVPNLPTTIQVKVQNTGAKRLDSCMVSFDIDNSGNWSTPEKVLLDPKLITNRIAKDYYNFSQKWTNPTSGTHTVCVATSRPNNKQDNYTQDDTLCVQIKVLDEIIFSPTDTQYCNSFDDPTQVEWIEKNTSNKKGLFSWQKGSPNQAPIIGAHSAPNAWMTKLNTNYKTRDSSSLFTPVFVADSGDVFKVNFWHNFKTELYHDGGTVDVTFDAGLTWRTIGYVLPNGQWFNTTHVTSLDVLDPGWSGESGGWINSEIKIQFDQYRKAVFRFRFASDQSFEYQGWAVDDFCMTLSDGEPDDFIGVDEVIDGDLIGVGNVIPNPTQGETMIPYVMNSPTDIKVSVFSLLGQQLINFNQNSEVGVNYIKFDVTGWTPGMYIVVIEVDGEQVTRKVVVR